MPVDFAKGFHAADGVVPVVRFAEHFQQQTGRLHGHEVVHKDVVGYDSEVASFLNAEFLRHLSSSPSPPARTARASVCCNFSAAELQYVGAIVGYEQGVDDERKRLIIHDFAIGEVVER